MNNEPVAWMYQIHDITGWTWVIDQRLPDYEYRNEKPLYTHPADLTHEEISDAWAKSQEDCIAMQQGFTTQQHYFAHLILRKASEK